MIDNSQLKKILALSDDELRKTISDAAMAAGADKYMTTKVLSDMAKLRGIVSSLTPEQLEKLMSKLGNEKVNEIVDRINKNN